MFPLRGNISYKRLTGHSETALIAAPQGEIMPSNNRNKLKNMSVIAVMAALAIILYQLSEIPVTATLKVNFSDVPAMIAAMVISPAAGIVTVAIRCLLHMIILGHTYGIGELIDFAIGAGMVLIFCNTRKFFLKKRSKKTAFAIASVFTCAGTLVLGLFLNILLFPVFSSLMHIPIVPETYIAHLVATIPTNALRSLITFAPMAFLLPLTDRLRKLIYS